MLMRAGDFKGGAVPKISIGFVDVREVAQAHLEALKREEVVNKRYILVEKAHFMNDISDILSKKYKGGPEGFNPCDKLAPLCLLKIIGCCNPEVKSMISTWG